MMVTRRSLLTLLLAPLGLGPLAGLAEAQSITPSNASNYFRVESQSGPGRDGQPTVWGYIHNERGLGNARVRILVETLDTSDKSIAQEIAYGRQRGYPLRPPLLRGAPEDAGRELSGHRPLGRLDP